MPRSSDAFHWCGWCHFHASFESCGIRRCFAIGCIVPGSCHRFGNFRQDVLVSTRPNRQQVTDFLLGLTISVRHGGQPSAELAPLGRRNTNALADDRCQVGYWTSWQLFGHHEQVWRRDRSRLLPAADDVIDDGPASEVPPGRHPRQDGCRIASHSCHGFQENKIGRDNGSNQSL